MGALIVISAQLEEKYGYFTSLAKLVEQLANDSGRKVTLVSHSMGGLIGSHFLTKQPPEWKDKYINLFVPISTPWLGSPMAVSGFIEGMFLCSPTRTILKTDYRLFCVTRDGLRISRETPKFIAKIV